MYYFGDQIKEDKMSVVFGKYGREKKMQTGFGGDTSRKGTTWKTQV